jgi:lipopolysaccharide export system ATP-binding protein
LAITDRSYIVRAGKILCHGTAEEVLNNPDAKKYYFGETPPGNPLDSTEAA